MKLDISRFKHIESDDKCAVLEDENGHQIRLAKHALGGKILKQLEDIIIATGKDGVKTKKRYGKVEVKDTEDKRLGKVIVKDDVEPEKMADGGKVPNYGKELTPDVMSMPAMSPEEATQYETREATKDKYNSIIGQQDITPGNVPGADAFMIDDKLDSMIGSTPEDAPKRLDPSVYGQAQAEVAVDKAADQAETNASAEKIIEENKARAAAGLPLLPMPEGYAPTSLPGDQAPALPQPATSGIAAGTAQPLANDPMAAIQKGVDLQQAGINAQAKAQGDLGMEQAAALERAQIADEQAMKAYNETHSVLSAEREALIQDIQDGHIDPNKFWTGNPKTGQGGHSKIMAGIGMILAGFNPTNSPNAAINFLEYQMDQDLKAQQANLSSKQSLLSANMQQFGDLRAATEMTRIMQKDILTNQLQKAAAEAQTPMAKAAAQQAIGQLQQQNAVSMQKFAAQQAVRNLTTAANNDPSKMDAVISALEATDPEKAKEYRARAVPGLGFASTSEGGEGLREMQTTVKTARQGIQRLREIMNTSGSTISPKLTKEAESIKQQLIGRFRVPMLGPGTMNAEEAARLGGLIPDPTHIFSMDSRSKAALDALEKGVMDSYRNQAIANGIKLPASQTASSEGGGGSDKRAKAEAWLKANPNSPEADGVRKAISKMK